MSNYIFTELTEEEFTSFAQKSNQSSFVQTKQMNDYYKLKGAETHYIGVKENNAVVAAALIYMQSTFRSYKKYDIYRGFILDYKNKELVEFITKETANYLAEKNAYCFTIDPYIIQVERDTDANIIENAKDNYDVIEQLKELGYYKSKTDVQQKWLYVIDINGKSSDEIFKNIKSSTRTKINRTTNKFKLNIKNLSYDELDQFKKITFETSARRGFDDKSLKYYQDMKKAFGDDVVFKIAELNCDKYIKTLENEKENYSNRLKKPNSKEKEILSEIDSLNKKIEDAKALQREKGNIIPLACGMFLLYGKEVIYLSGGSYNEYMQFCAQYLIQWEMIKYACDNNYSQYNFYGIFDVFNPEGKDYGVYEFKKRFNGYVKEILGEYTYPINKKVYSQNENINSIKEKIKKVIKK